MAAGKRTSLASLANQKTEDVPGRSDPILMSIPLDKLVATRFNPRRDFGTEEELKEFGLVLAKQQLQPAVVVSRAAYLRLWPDEGDSVGDAVYVVANGERRLRGSCAAGRPTLEVVLRDEIAASRATFLDAVLSENIDREDLNPIERAFAIDTMVSELGGAGAVAKHYGKTDGWVSQMRSLLKLAPETQALVATGEMPVRFARGLTKLSAADQLAAWEQEKVEAAERALAGRQRKPARRTEEVQPQPAAHPRTSPVQQPSPSHHGTPTPPADEAQRFTAVNHGSGATRTAADSRPEPTPTVTEASKPLGTPEQPSSGLPVPRPAGEVSPPAQPAEAEGRQLAVPVAPESALEELTDVQRSLILHRYVHSRASTGGVAAIAEDFSRGLDERHRAGLADILRTVADMVAPPSLQK